MRAHHPFTLLLGLVLAGTAGCGAADPTPAPSGAGPTAGTRSPAYDRAYALGLDAYVYGLPLLVTNATFQTMTSVTVSQGAFGPVNQFNHVRSANTASSTAVVAPGASSLSSIAWLDLTGGPMVLHVPAVTGHHYVLALVDPYTENLRNFSDAAGTTPGDYVIAAPGQQDVALPPGAERVDVTATRIWIIGSTQLKGADDVPAVNAIQDGYTLTPLRAPGTTAQQPNPSTPVTTVTQAALPTGVDFFDVLGRQLAAFPPPAADAPELAKLAAVGIGPGRRPSADPSLDADTLDGLAAAVAAGPATVSADVQQLYKAGFTTHGGYFLGGFGSYGTDYQQRAVVATVGLGAFLPQQAVYAMAWSDAAGTPLDGSTAYALHMAAPPPSRQGWSVTVYNLQGGLEANPLGRFAFTDTSDLATNADGSIDITLAATQPADATAARNWLPVTAGAGFEVIWRLFAPDADALDGILDGSGWQPPAITPRS